jgi:hypothetical protein
MRSLTSLFGAISRFADGFRGASWDKAARDAIQEDKARFRELRSLDQAESAKLRARVDALLDRQLEFLRGQQAAQQIMVRVCWVLGVVGVVGAPFMVIGLFQPPNLEPAALTFQYILLIFVLLLLAYWPLVVARTLKLGSRVIYVWLSLVLSGSVGLVVVTARQMRTGAPAAEEAALLAALLAIIVMTIALYAYPLIVGWSSIALQRAWSVEQPESRVVAALIKILSVLEATRDDGNAVHGDGQSPRPLYITGRLWALLDQGVEAVRQGLPRLLNPYDSSDPAVQSSTAQVAAGLRQLRTAMVLPNGAAREEDIRRVRDALKAWVVGTVEEALAPFAVAWLISTGLSALDRREWPQTGSQRSGQEALEVAAPRRAATHRPTGGPACRVPRPTRPAG